MVGVVEQGHTVAALEEMPPFPEESGEYWDAFWILSNGRTRAMNGSNPVALSEIMQLFALKGIDDATEREEYIYVVRRLDSLYLKLEAEKLNAQAKAEAERRRNGGKRS